jgi:hypothetical protein
MILVDHTKHVVICQALVISKSVVLALGWRHRLDVVSRSSIINAEVKNMDTISLQVSGELAGRLLPLKDRLPEILELGLRYLPEQAPLTPRQQAEKLWEAAGLLVARDPGTAGSTAPIHKRRTPIQAGGKPASEIIIQHRRMP